MFPPRYGDPRPIARGAMGVVYHAVDAVLGRDVAIKVLGDEYLEHAEGRERFTREALAAARLSGDPNTVTIYDVGDTDDGRPYIVMQYVGGGSLEDVLRAEGVQPPALALRWLEQTARALDHAHEKGIVHRDVKPGNVLLDDRGDAHVADFGIASAAGAAALTVAGTVLGTAGYLAPEQAEGRRATPASDRYAHAVVGYELLTGGRPYAADTPTAEAAAHVNAPVPVPDGYPALAPVFARALAKEPGSRYASAREFVDALRTALATSTAPTRALVPARSRRPLVAPAAALALAAAAVAGLALAAIRSGAPADPLSTQPKQAVLQETPVPTTTAPEPAVVDEDALDEHPGRGNAWGKKKGKKHKHED